MLSDILRDFSVDYFAFIGSDRLSVKNARLHSSLPERCNAVFMLFPYYTGENDASISKYACVHDYHIFAKKVFDSAKAYLLEKYPDSFVQGYSDHSPFEEVGGAALCGLGLLGRHSLLINERYSSFVFIGELVCGLSDEILIGEGIPKGDGILRRCEGCALCERACPSACAGSDDRSLCISHITQKKLPLSEDEERLILRSASIWGCDACQDACPHTRAAIAAGTIFTPIEFFSRSVLKPPVASTILSMDDGEFALYPFAWRKRAVIERNINILKKGEKL